MITSRRNFVRLLAAPAIVRASSLMKVVPLPEPEFPLWGALQWGGKITITKFEPIRIGGYTNAKWELKMAEFARNYAATEDQMLRAALR